jgi:hypothetical protein
LLPAGEREKEEQAAEEREGDRKGRRPSGRELGELLRDEAAPAEREGKARGAVRERKT